MKKLRIKKLRTRLTGLMFVIVIVTCALSVVFSFLVRSGLLFDRGNAHDIIAGVFIKDALLLLVTLIIAALVLYLLSKRPTNPLLVITNATKEVAAGNLDVEVSINDRIEEYSELQRNFNTMVKELKSNELQRRSFVSSVSHELKTPLAIINGYADLIGDGDLTKEELQEYAGYISNESKRLEKLVSNLLRLSRMENQGIKGKPEEYSLDEQIRQVILLLEPLWGAKGIELDLSLAPCRYTGDRELMEQVWLNLLDNAVKFSPEGGEISILVKDEGGLLTVSVADEGPGMDVETKLHLFERFYQADTPHKNEGSGLGLSIVKQILDLSGGGISANSSPGEGTEFVVTLPRG